MNPTRRLASLLIFALLLLVGLGASKASAQTTNQDARYLFADTTLVRDTLGLTFERLFPLADSLRMTPAALRGLSVTYGWTLARLVKMADSLEVPIDSVGPIMLRERANPLAQVESTDRMTYTSRYTPSGGGDTWQNTLDYSANRGRLFLTTQVDVRQEQRGRGGSIGRRETRSATPTLFWRFSPRFSMGGNATLTRFDDISNLGRGGQAERVNKYGFSLVARPKPVGGFTTNLNVVATLDDINRIQDEQSGPFGQVTGGVRYNNNWFSHDFTFNENASIRNAAATDPNPDDDLEYPEARARSAHSGFRGTLNVLRNRPVELSMNYQLDNDRNQTAAAVNDSSRLIIAGPSGPETTLVIKPFTNKQLIRIEKGSLDATLRVKPVSFANFDIGWRGGQSESENSTLVSATRSGTDRALTANGRAEFGALSLTSTFSVTSTNNRYPKRDFPRGGYAEDSERRNLSANATWQISSVYALNLESGISLDRARYGRIDSALTIPVAHDGASQFYNLVLNYKPSLKLSNTVGLRVTRSENVNLPAASTGSNSNSRAYAATWNWSYQILEGLTANQQNTLTADYTTYPFALSTNRVALSYFTLTRLNAVLTPRFRIDLTHTARFQPSGNYRPILSGDPTEYFSRADETINYTLDAKMDYSPIPAISINVNPSYSANTRNTTQTGALAPQRDSRSLQLGGGANLNLQVGSRGRLTGSISRRLSSERTTTYGTTGANATRSESRFLNGDLSFTWTL